MKRTVKLSLGMSFIMLALMLRRGSGDGDSVILCANKPYTGRIGDLINGVIDAAIVTSFIKSSELRKDLQKCRSLQVGDILRRGAGVSQKDSGVPPWILLRG